MPTQKDEYLLPLLNAALTDIQQGKELPMGFVANLLNEARVELEEWRTGKRWTELPR